MTEKFSDMLAEDGKKNSLGRAEEVVQLVIDDKSRLDELYSCLFEDNPWLRMRAIDAFEKVCQVHPKWIEPYIDRLFDDFGNNTQASIQWHIAEIIGETNLTSTQKKLAADWLVTRLEDDNVDWIVAANTMKTLEQFVRDGSFARDQFIPLLYRQQKHRSNAVVKRATKILDSFQ